MLNNPDFETSNHTAWNSGNVSCCNILPRNVKMVLYSYTSTIAIIITVCELKNIRINITTILNKKEDTQK